MKAALPLLLLGAQGAGCAREKAESGLPPIQAGSGDTGHCTGGTPPTTTAVALENVGLKPNEVGDLVAALAVRASATDKDGDLASYHIDAWYDDLVDGAVAANPDQDFDGLGTLSDQGPCSLTQATVSAYATVGDVLPPDTLIEWGVIVTDGHLLPSAMAITSGYTPNTDGTDGGPAAAGVGP